MIGRPLVRISPNLTTVSSVHLIKLQFPVIITISLHQVNNQSYLLVMLSGSLGSAPTRKQIGQVLWFCTLHWVHWQNTSLLPFLQVFFGPLVSLEGHRLGISFSAFQSNHRMPQYTSTYVWTPMVVLRSNLLDWGENPLLSGISQTVCSYADMFRICVLSLTCPPHSIHVFVWLKCRFDL